jgi:hypothetical protein
VSRWGKVLVYLPWPRARWSGASAHCGRMRAPGCHRQCGAAERGGVRWDGECALLRLNSTVEGARSTFFPVIYRSRCVRHGGKGSCMVGCRGAVGVPRAGRCAGDAVAMWGRGGELVGAVGLGGE